MRLRTVDRSLPSSVSCPDSVMGTHGRGDKLALSQSMERAEGGKQGREGRDMTARSQNLLLTLASLYISRVMRKAE